MNLNLFKNEKEKDMPIQECQFDIVEYEYYDTATIKSGEILKEVTTIDLFLHPIGTLIGNHRKSHVDTNMQLACMLPQPQWFQVKEISANRIRECMDSDFNQFVGSSTWEFWIGNKVYAQGLLQNLYERNVYLDDKSLTILQAQYFAFKIHLEYPLITRSDVSVKIGLKGQLARGVK